MNKLHVFSIIEVSKNISERKKPGAHLIWRNYLEDLDLQQNLWRISSDTLH